MTELPNDAFWVLPGRLMAGPYPGAPTRRKAETTLTELLEHGVRCFIDLTEEGEGPPLHPYEHLLRDLGRAFGVPVAHLRFGIRDVDVPTPWLMEAILGAIDAALAAGEVVYVHCWGGVGRTGTVLGCRLVEADGLSPADALLRLKALRSGTQRAHRRSPETDAQDRFVAAWARRSEARVPLAGEIAATLAQHGTLTLDGPRLWSLHATAADDEAVVVVDDGRGGPPTLDDEQASVAAEVGLSTGAGGVLRFDGTTHEGARRTARFLEDVARLSPTGLLRAQDVPSATADWGEIAVFAHRFDGYAHFGDDWVAERDRIYDVFLRAPETLSAVELRALLFFAFRADRFTYGDDVVLSEPDEDGVRHVRNNPDFDRSPMRLERGEMLDHLRRALGP